MTHKKLYKTMTNIGSTKYFVSFHDGKKTHKDGSPFFDGRGFSDKKKFTKFVHGLEKEGYKEKDIYKQKVCF